MIRGVGVDVCAVERIAATYADHGERFLQRVLTPTERAQRTWDASSLARRWACKEAVAKACATGIGGVVGFQDIEITYAANGAPQCQVRGQTGQFWVSVSDDAGMATAFALWSHA
ncbi:MAG: holo-ACP synthase [Alphaproteobacteria bacterium]|nr:holo-ACP synthase [Alphaproteobacteria bacterium]